jgi:asparagine synthase (glutamine-hydrolysing)
MCGIAGLISSAGLERRTIERMTDRLAHRGPDDRGVWIDPEAKIAFGHRRLSIIDLSAAGHQPMESSDGRYVIIYNGEIYNHAALRAEIEAAGGGPSGNGWHGHSDTETLVEAIALWGLDRALLKCVGMFAIALWDRSERRLQLVRDRFGEKPLYYGWVGGDFVFASELKSIRCHAAFDNPIHRGALGSVLARGYVPAPHSIYQRIFKLEPGTILALDPAAAATASDAPPHPDGPCNGISISRYWSYRQVVADGLADPIRGEAEAIDRLERVLAEAITGQSIADVPVGAFLSGGIDSSTVVAIYQKYSSQTVRTFSIGFEEPGYDEAPFARTVARHLGTEHHERYVAAAEALDVIPRLASIYDEPFADSSQIPTYLVSRFAREQVKVAISGDGGDELFGGYNRHFAAARAWAQMRRLPAPLRAAAGRLLGLVPPSVWRGIVNGTSKVARAPHYGVKVQKGFRTMAASHSLEDVLASFLDDWWGEASPVLGGGGAAGELPLDLDVPASDSVRMMYCDAVTYLPDDILCKVDRAAMAVSLETRVPFLDHRVAAFAARIPIDMKIRGGTGKHILRRLLDRHVPAALFERPKSGFAIPLAEWLRGPLRPWAEELLGPNLEEDGLIDASAVRRRWGEHVKGRRDWSTSLWSVLMFQDWLAAQRDGRYSR